jgi:hypothetical protein
MVQQPTTPTEAAVERWTRGQGRRPTETSTGALSTQRHQPGQVPRRQPRHSLRQRPIGDRLHMQEPQQTTGVPSRRWPQVRNGWSPAAWFSPVRYRPAGSVGACPTCPDH